MKKFLAICLIVGCCSTAILANGRFDPRNDDHAHPTGNTNHDGIDFDLDLRHTVWIGGEEGCAFGAGFGCD